MGGRISAGNAIEKRRELKGKNRSVAVAITVSDGRSAAGTTDRAQDMSHPLLSPSLAVSTTSGPGVVSVGEAAWAVLAWCA